MIKSVMPEKGSPGPSRLSEIGQVHSEEIYGQERPLQENHGLLGEFQSGLLERKGQASLRTSRVTQREALVFQRSQVLSERCQDLLQRARVS